MSVEQIVQQWQERIADDAIFFRPNIPQRKLVGAITTYAPGITMDEILVLVDNTVFGGAGDGMLITPTLFIGRDMGELPVRVEIAEVSEVRLEDGFLGRKIFVNGGRLLATLNCPGEPGTLQLVAMMRAMCARGAAAVDEDPLAAATILAHDCQSCGAPIPPTEGACSYCGRARG